MKEYLKDSFTVGTTLFMAAILAAADGLTKPGYMDMVREGLTEQQWMWGKAMQFTCSKAIVILVLAGVFLTCCMTSQAISLNTGMAVLCAGMIAAAISAKSGASSWMPTCLLLALQVLVCEKSVVSKSSKWYAAALIPILVLEANVHTFALSFHILFLLPYAMESWKFFLAGSAACVASLFANPFLRGEEMFSGLEGAGKAWMSLVQPSIWGFNGVILAACLSVLSVSAWQMAMETFPLKKMFRILVLPAIMFLLSAHNAALMPMLPLAAVYPASYIFGKVTDHEIEVLNLEFFWTADIGLLGFAVLRLLGKA